MWVPMENLKPKNGGGRNFLISFNISVLNLVSRQIQELPQNKYKTSLCKKKEWKKQEQSCLKPPDNTFPSWKVKESGQEEH